MVTTMDGNTGTRRISWAHTGREPFRVLFPAGVLAGVTGVLLWPLHLLGGIGAYPGPSHTHLMVAGFFGAFIVGFLGTALPRMLSSRPLAPWQTILLATLHVAMTAAFAIGQTVTGDLLQLAVLAGFGMCLVPRFLKRQDTPPPGFVLVALGFACAVGGAVLDVIIARGEPDPALVPLQRLLAFQGFVLLPVLGVGPYIVPRLLGRDSLHDFPESAPTPPHGWTSRALVSLLVGAVVLGSFWVEAYRSAPIGHGLRALAVSALLWRELPAVLGSSGWNLPSTSVRLAIACVPIGYASAALFPTLRTALLHIVFMSGFSLLTLLVATRVVFGHSGNLHQLAGRNRWLATFAGLVILAMTTRISGDFWPKIQFSHYIYGAIAWAAGAVVWAWRAVPLLFQTDDD